MTQTTAQPHALTLSNTPEHYTPASIIERVHKVMGGIDLDPASCVKANETVRAAHIWTKEDDGLARSWAFGAGRVFINPPGDRRGELPKRFWAKLADEVGSGHVREVVWLAFNLAQLRTVQWAGEDENAQRGAARLLSHCDVCVLKRRLRFTGDSPTKDNAVLYWGPNRSAFEYVFGTAGQIWFGRPQQMGMFS